MYNNMGNSYVISKIMTYITFLLFRIAYFSKWMSNKRDLFEFIFKYFLN